MSWSNEDGVHEGWCAAEFTGGWVSVGWDDRGIMVRRPGPDGQIDFTGEPQHRTGEEVLGWRSICECGWRGPRWERVATPAEHRPADRRVYVPYDKADLEPDEVEDAAHREWKDHLEPASLTDLRQAAAEVRDAQDRLTDAVRGARRDGRSWTDIGGAVGITRQAARERWARLTGEIPATTRGA